MATCAADYEFYNKEAGRRISELSKDGLVAVFVYSKNVYANGKTQKIDSANPKMKTVAFGGEIYAPVVFFTSFLGFEVAVKDGAAVVSRGEKSAEIKARQSGGAWFLPIADLVRISDELSYFTDGSLAVVGKPDAVREVEYDADLITAAGYLVFGEYNISGFTAKDFLAARQKLKLRLVGSPEINDLSNETILGKIQNLDKHAENLWQKMHKEPDRFILWGDAPPVESEELYKQYSGLQALARAYGTYGSRFYMNEEIASAVIEGVRWMYLNMFGEAEIEGRGWRDAHKFNWYFWFVSTSDYLTDIFSILEGRFTLEERRQYFKCFWWCTTFMRHWFLRDAAVSRVLCCTKAAIACEMPEKLYIEYVDFDMLLGLEESGEGPRVDLVHWAHGMPYNNAYGRHNLDRVLLIASILSGTELEFASPKQYNLAKMVKYMFEPAMYESQAFIMFAGRNTDRCESRVGAEIMADMLMMYGMFGEEEDEYMRRFIKRNLKTEKSIAALKNRAEYFYCRLVDEILADDSIDTSESYEYAHAWFTGDRAVQHRNGYAFALALSSKRLSCSYESINSANKTGWYTGDGATYLYTGYDREAFDNPNFFCTNINIAYRFPGTTEDSRERVVRSISYGAKGLIPLQSFVGSMQLEDKYIVATMDFLSFKFEGEDTHPDDSDSGGSIPPHKNDLKAKKSWFCFDDEIVCLGAGITSTMNSPVHTTVEHRRIPGGKMGVLTDTYSELSPASSFGAGAARGVLIDGHAGFVFLGGDSVYVNRYEWGENAQEYAEIGIDHGANPKDATYAYAILPYATKESLAEYCTANDVTVISNTAKVQAVRESTTALSCYVFHEVGKCEDIEALAPCMASLLRQGGEVKLSVSDPSRELESLTLVLDGEYTAEKDYQKITLATADGKTTVSVDVKDANGRKFELVLKKA